jgi:hypothetical protein
MLMDTTFIRRQTAAEHWCGHVRLAMRVSYTFSEFQQQQQQQQKNAVFKRRNADWYVYFRPTAF